MKYRIIYFVILHSLAFTVITKAGESSAVVTTGHAHNDYLHTRPLWDAIENNFISIEVDIHLIGKALLVGHDEEDLRENLTLQSLYLNPLRSYVNAHNGWVYPQQDLILLIDVKSSPETTYQILRTELAKYSDILTSYDSNHIKKRAVSVVISGNRSRESMLNENIRYATYDGRLQDLSSGMPPTFMALVSDDWEEHFVWRGKGQMPSKDRNKLSQIVNSAHSAGYRIRFWNLPTNAPEHRKAVWTELISLGVDLISVDDLKAYQAFFISDFADAKN